MMDYDPYDKDQVDAYARILKEQEKSDISEARIWSLLMIITIATMLFLITPIGFMVYDVVTTPSTIECYEVQK